MLRSLLFGAASLLLATTPVLAVDCVQGAYIIVARNSGESAGTGTIGSVASAVAGKIPQSTVVAVDYPATLSDYQSSEAAGVKAARSLLINYVDACAGHHVIMMGYSQGAQVIGDVLIGTTEQGFTKDAPVAPKYTDAVVALIQMGDPAHVVKEPGSVGNASLNGIFARQDISGYNSSGLAARRQSYCDFNDNLCASGASGGINNGYVAEYGDAAQSFALSAYTSASQASAAAASSSSAAAAATASASAATTGSASITGSATRSSSAARSTTTSASTYNSLVVTIPVFGVVTRVTSGAFTNPPELPYSAFGSGGMVPQQIHRNEFAAALGAAVAFAAGLF